MKRCYSCFETYEDILDVCPNCGEVNNPEPKEPIYLYPGSILVGRYIIGHSVGAGGFGVVYKAWDSKLDTTVAIKEYFPRRISTRAPGTYDLIPSKSHKEEFEYRKKRFLAEARCMAKMGKHRSIPNVFEFFEANNSAYIVMELLEGMALNEYLKKVTKKIDANLAVMIAVEVGNALKSLHENGIIHRDVAPDNIFICSDKDVHVKLFDLGAARLDDDTDDVIDIVIKPGYSPVEQSENSKEIGPWTDVYALGATLYMMVTGIKPEASANRKVKDEVLSPREIDNDISENLSNAIMKAMAVHTHMRFQTVDDFIAAISGERKVVALDKERKIRKLKRIVGIVAAFLLIAITGLSVLSKYNEKKSIAILKPADLTMWIAVSEGSSEEAATQAVIDDFTSKFPDIHIELTAFNENEYLDAISKAAAEDNLPNIFESTGLEDNVLENAANLNDVLDSERATECYFLDHYTKYYEGRKKQLPLAIEVPMAVVITSGDVSLDYTNSYFSSLTDFVSEDVSAGKQELLALDESKRNLILKNIPEIETVEQYLGSKAEFLSAESHKYPVLLTSSMEIEDVKKRLLNYEEAYVFFDSDVVRGNYIYEWSMSSGSDNQNMAATRLMEWMLGNVYQNLLMVSMCNDGQIPINKECYEYKLDDQFLSPLKSLTEKIVMDGEIRKNMNN